MTCGSNLPARIARRSAGAGTFPAGLGRAASAGDDPVRAGGCADQPLDQPPTAVTQGEYDRPYELEEKRRLLYVAMTHAKDFCQDVDYESDNVKVSTIESC